MGHKRRPFTRKQRAKQLKARKLAEREERKSAREELREWLRTVAVFRGADAKRTEELADGR